MELNDLIQRIQNANETDAIEVDETSARFARQMTWLNVETIDDAFLFFASMNVLNAYVKRSNAGEDFFKRYEFKRDIVRVLERLIQHPIENVTLYFDVDVAYIDIKGLQFSFHHLPKSTILNEYRTSEANIPVEWKGIRLQPFAKLILDEAIEKANPSLKTRIQPIDPVRVFASLSHPIRYRIFIALLSRNLTQIELAKVCEVDPTKISSLIRPLIDVNLVVRVRKGNQSFYQINTVALGQLVTLFPKHPR